MPLREFYINVNLQNARYKKKKYKNIKILDIFKINFNTVCNSLSFLTVLYA